MPPMPPFSIDDVESAAAAAAGAMVAIIAGSVVGGLCCCACVVALIVLLACKGRRPSAGGARLRGPTPGAAAFAQGSSKLGEHGSEKMALTVQGSSGGVMATKI